MFVSDAAAVSSINSLRRFTRAALPIVSVTPCILH